MIRGVIIVNNHGKPRLVKFYQTVVSEHGAVMESKYYNTPKFACAFGFPPLSVLRGCASSAKRGLIAML